MKSVPILIKYNHCAKMAGLLLLGKAGHFLLPRRGSLTAHTARKGRFPPVPLPLFSREAKENNEVWAAAMQNFCLLSAPERTIL